MNRIRDKILIYLKGMLMWACDVIPWVSWWTIAVITRIYERLIQAIKNVVPNLKLFFTWKWKTFWKNIDGNFLLCLILWIWTSIVLFANIITSAMENYPILIWSFFVGLILISAVFLGKQVKWNWKTVLCLIIFWILAFFITAPTNTPLSITSTWRWTFICGAIAICAMILPGISGSFMLVLLWMYETIMLAVKNFDIATLCIFWAWAVIWIVLFSNVLSWLFKHYKMITLASLTGFMLWSLNKIWPWKEIIDETNDVWRNVLPNQYEAITWDSNQILWAIICFLAWIGIVLLIEYLGKKFSKKW